MRGKRCSRQERGIVLILIAAALAIIVGIVGLAIDLGIGLGGSTDQQQLANTLASGLLDAYLRSTATSQGDRISQAIQQAEKIAALPENAPFFKPFLANPGQAIAFCDNSSGSTSCDFSTHQGAVVAGYWCADKTATTGPCSGLTAADEVPLMKRWDGSQTESLTAFQIELKQSSTTAIKTTFMKLLGVPSLRASGIGTAATVPRQIIFSVDLSSSVVGESHPAVMQDYGDGTSGIDYTRTAMAAYKLVSSIKCTSDHHLTDDPCTGSYAGLEDGVCKGIVSSLTVGAARNYEQFNVSWDSLGASRGSDTSQTTHYKDDYHCWHVNNDNGSAADYLIDTYSNPEPLTTILTSINRALRVLKARRNAGDKVQLSFFDTFVLQPREIPYLPNSGAFQLADALDSDVNFQLMEDLTAPLPADAGAREAILQKRITEHNIFPRVNPLKQQVGETQVDPADVGGVWSHIGFALNRAAAALARNGNVYARRNVVMFSDFLDNCWGYPENNTVCNDNGEWDTTWGSIIEDALPVVWRQYAAGGGGTSKITFNPIVIGDYVAPHNRPVVDGHGTGCLWNEKDVRRNLWQENGNHGRVDTFRDYPPPDPKPPGYVAKKYNYYPNAFFTGAADTGGEWGVIREPCCDLEAGLTPATVKARIDAACVEFSTWCSNDDDPYGDDCVGGYRPAGWAPKYNYGMEAWPFLDYEARLMCDPGCQSRADQMNQYMTNIMGSNSIVLVQSKAPLISGTSTAPTTVTSTRAGDPIP